MDQKVGKMKKNICSDSLSHYKVHIPAKKLPSSLAQELCSPLWRNIIQSIENNDVDAVFKLVERIGEQKENLILPHPFVENVETFPVNSLRQGMCNFIFFNDESTNNPWILCQCTSFIDAIFSETYSGKHKSSANDLVILKAIKTAFKTGKLNQAKTLCMTKKAVFSGYLLDQTRPYHHFYDQLKWMVHLQNDQPIVSKKSFFTPKYFKKRKSITSKQTTYSMFPLVIGSNQLGIKLDKYSDKMEKIVKEDSFKGLRGGILHYRLNQVLYALKRITHKNKTLTLWFGISGEKRMWIEQEDFLPALVQQFKPWFNSFVFMIDGFTQYEDNNYHPVTDCQSSGIMHDLEIVNAIKKKLLPFSNVSIINLVGKTYRKKIQQCQFADFFIANAGAGQLVPHRFCKKRGILHSNEKHCVFSMGIDNATVKLVDKSLVTDVGNLFATSEKMKQNKNRVGLISYSIQEQVVIDMMINMLGLSKQIKPVAAEENKV